VREWVKTLKWKKGASRSNLSLSHAWHLKSYQVMIGTNEVEIILPMNFDDVDALQSLTGSLKQTVPYIKMQKFFPFQNNLPTKKIIDR